MKVTKLNNYESNYEHRVTEVRDGELSFLHQELAVWAMSLVLIVVSPVLATASTFAVFVLIDEDNILTASRSFSVLLLFSALRFPINFAGRLLGSMLLVDDSYTRRPDEIKNGYSLMLRHNFLEAAQAYSSVQRIARFLDRELRAGDGEGHRSPLKTATPLVVENATFYAGPAETPSFQIAKFNLAVEKGEVLAVCGPVGGEFVVQFKTCCDRFIL